MSQDVQSPSAAYDTPVPVQPAGAQRCRLAYALWIFGGLVFVVGLLGVDRWFYEQISLRLNSEDPLQPDLFATAHWVWELFRYAGSVTGALVVYFLVIAVHPQGWRTANAGLLSVAATDAVGLFLKLAIGRLRPDRADSHLAFVHPFSAFFRESAVCMPSGEATAAFALATVLSILYPRLCALWYAVAFLTAATRVLGGAHYLSDAAAGAMLGTALVHVMFRFIQSRGWKYAG